MRRMTIGLVLAGLLLAPALGAQEPPVADTSLQAILAVLKGEADPTLLHKKRGAAGWCCLGFGSAADVLGQYTGPELGTDRPGGHRSQAELDAFAEELIAIAVATRNLPTILGHEAHGFREVFPEGRIHRPNPYPLR